MKRRRLLSLGLAAILASGVLTGCGSSGSGNSASPAGSSAAAEVSSTAGTAAQAGKTEGSTAASSEISATENGTSSGEGTPLRIGVAAYDGSSFDPIAASDGFSIAILGNIIGGLYNYDDNNVPQLELAKSVDESDDGLTQTFTLRDATWSDGEPLTADDFVYAWQRLADPASGSEMSYLIGDAHIKNAADIIAGKADPSTLGVTAVDDKTLKVEFDQPCPYFPSLSSFSALSPLPRKFVEEQGDQFAQSKDNLVFLGAYTLADWDVAGNTITLKKNPNYWDADHVTVDEIDFQVVPDAQQGVMSYENGDLDRVVISGNLASKYATDPEFSSSLGVFNWYLEFNEDEVPDEKLRQAIGYAIDNEDIATNILKDGSIPQYNILMSGLYFNDDGEDFNDACPDHFKYDPDKAKELWKEAQSETDQRSLTILYESDNTTIANVAAYVQNAIESTLDGFTVELETLPKKNRLDRMESGDFQAALHRWGPDFADPACIMTMYTTDSDYNYGHFSDKEYDELVKSCDTTLATDPKARWDAYLKAENILGESGSVIPLFQLADAALTKSNVHGITNHVSGVACWYKYVTVD